MNFQRLSRILFLISGVSAPLEGKSGHRQPDIMHRPHGRRTMVTGQIELRIERTVTMPALHQSRLIVGLLLVMVAVLLWLSGAAHYSTAGVIAIGVLGLISIAISRRK
jgi:hypothetical protein